MEKHSATSCAAGKHSTSGAVLDLWEIPCLKRHRNRSRLSINWSFRMWFYSQCHFQLCGDHPPFNGTLVLFHSNFSWQNSYLDVQFPQQICTRSDILQDICKLNTNFRREVSFLFTCLLVFLFSDILGKSAANVCQRVSIVHCRFFFGYLFILSFCSTIRTMALTLWDSVIHCDTMIRWSRAGEP